MTKSGSSWQATATQEIAKNLQGRLDHQDTPRMDCIFVVI